MGANGRVFSVLQDVVTLSEVGAPPVFSPAVREDLWSPHPLRGSLVPSSSPWYGGDLDGSHLTGVW